MSRDRRVVGGGGLGGYDTIFTTYRRPAAKAVAVMTILFIPSANY